MKSYRGVITAEIVVLLGLVALTDDRLGKAWAAIWGNVTPAQGSGPSTGTATGWHFTVLGTIVAAWAAIRYGKGTFGLLVAYLLGSLVAVTLVRDYAVILPYFIQSTAAAPASSSTGTPKGVA